MNQLAGGESAASSPVLNYEYLSHLIVPLGALSSAAELHGLLTGELAAGSRPSLSDWQAGAVEFLDLAEAAAGALLQALEGLHGGTLEQLQSESFNFKLLLPNDETELSQRAVALGEWCRGFLSGFALAGQKDETQMPEDIKESLHDLASIVHIEVDGSGEEDETGFFEVCEYVRMAALTLFLEFESAGMDSNFEQPNIERSSAVDVAGDTDSTLH